MAPLVRSGLLVLAVSLVLADPAAATVTIDDTASGSGSQISQYTVGETFTPPSTDRNLESFSFYGSSAGATSTVRGAIYEWDDAQNEAPNRTAEFESDPVVIPADVSAQELQFSTGGLVLDPAKTYVAILTRAFDPPGGGTLYVQTRSPDVLPGNKFLINAPDPGYWPTTPWGVDSTEDATFKATFDQTPVCFADGTSGSPGEATHPTTKITVQLDCNAASSTAAPISIVQQPGNGTLSSIIQATSTTPASVDYTPNNGFTDAVDSFTFHASDGTHTSAAAGVFVHVGDLAPACTFPPNEGYALFTEFETPVTWPPTCTDPEHDHLSFFVSAQPAHGAVADNGDGTATYTPAAGFSGSDQFTGGANDGSLESNTGIVYFYVDRQERAPVCTDTSVTVLARSTNNKIPLTCTDPDGDNLNYTVVTQPTFGTLTPPPYNQWISPVTYAVFSAGEGSFTFKANDGQLESNVATAHITVTALQTTSTQQTQQTLTPTTTTQPTLPPVVPVCTVPKLVGRTLKQAKALLKNANCALGKVTRKHAPKKKRGRVLKQRPQANTNNPAGTKIALTVGR